jgi:hypothetical protein
MVAYVASMSFVGVLPAPAAPRSSRAPARSSTVTASRASSCR